MFSGTPYKRDRVVSYRWNWRKLNINIFVHSSCNRFQLCHMDKNHKWVLFWFRLVDIAINLFFFIATIIYVDTHIFIIQKDLPICTGVAIIDNMCICKSEITVIWGNARGILKIVRPSFDRSNILLQKENLPICWNTSHTVS